MKKTLMYILAACLVITAVQATCTTTLSADEYATGDAVIMYTDCDSYYDDPGEVYYGWLNASGTKEWRAENYKYIRTETPDSTVIIDGAIYGYISVSDYNDSDATWISNDNIEGVFIDGIDQMGSEEDFGRKLKELVEYVEDKDKRVILNTYIYNEQWNEFAEEYANTDTYRESSITRWNGSPQPTKPEPYDMTVQHVTDKDLSLEFTNTGDELTLDLSI